MLAYADQGTTRTPGPFFHSLKAEVTRGVTYHSQTALRTELARYIRHYNTVRLHSSLNYQSPLAFERQAA